MPNTFGFLPHLRQIGKLIDNGDGSYSEQVAVVNGASALSVGIAPPSQAAATAAGSIAPAADTVICTLTFAVAGNYRIEIEMATQDPAAAGHYLFVQHDPGAKHFDLLATPGTVAIVWSSIPVANGDTIYVKTGTAATGAGLIVAGAIRAYLLA